MHEASRQPRRRRCVGRERRVHCTGKYYVSAIFNAANDNDRSAWEVAWGNYILNEVDPFPGNSYLPIHPSRPAAQQALQIQEAPVVRPRLSKLVVYTGPAQPPPPPLPAPAIAHVETASKATRVKKMQASSVGGCMPNLLRTSSSRLSASLLWRPVRLISAEAPPVYGVIHENQPCCGVAAARRDRERGEHLDLGDRRSYCFRSRSAPLPRVGQHGVKAVVRPLNRTTSIRTACRENYGNWPRDYSRSSCSPCSSTTRHRECPRPTAPFHRSEFRTWFEIRLRRRGCIEESKLVAVPSTWKLCRAYRSCFLLCRSFVRRHAIVACEVVMPSERAASVLSTMR